MHGETCIERQTEILGCSHPLYQTHALNYLSFLVLTDSGTFPTSVHTVETEYVWPCSASGKHTGPRSLDQGDKHIQNSNGTVFSKISNIAHSNMELTMTGKYKRIKSEIRVELS